MNNFLPITRKECDELGWGAPDFVYVSGDAYVDHPSFGTAIITRVLEDAGFSVGIIAQPDYKNMYKDGSSKGVCVFGRPRLGFLVSSGNMDSMVAHYTASKKRRSEDFYSFVDSLLAVTISIAAATVTYFVSRQWLNYLTKNVDGLYYDRYSLLPLIFAVFVLEQLKFCTCKCKIGGNDV